MSLNRLRELFQSGKGAVGTFVSMGNESVVECLGYTGLDFVIIDTEHGPFDTETMMQLIRAAERVGLVPVVRIANVDHKEIQRAADCGAQGLIVPCLRDIKDFQKTVALAKYAPIGQRGFIKGRGTGFGQLPWAATDTLEEYYANSNERLMVIPQKPWNKSKKSPPWKASMASLLALSICRHPWAFRDDSHILISWQRKRVS